MDETELAGLVDRATHWRDADPDPRTRREVDRLIELVTSGDSIVDEVARDDLAQRFSGSLQFGTAGLRGALGAGPNRMNRAVVIRAAAGIAGHLHAAIGADGAAPPRVVVGYDARHDSDVFARDTCAVLTAAGCVAQLLPAPLPTPVLAFALRRFDADAGIMVTASHNPPQDNGYKVYLGGRADSSPGSGAQIVPPMDDHIAHQIAAAPPAIDVPMATDGWEHIGPEIVDEYLASLVRVVTPGAARDIDIVLTPMHGVGGGTAVKAFAAAGFPAPHLVREQAEPDPDFPTVSFPNPEEPGALDLALAAARKRGADLVIANDPDADRCAVAVPGASGWQMLRGDEVGALLGEYLLSRSSGDAKTVACSIVSSQLLARVAAAHGARHVETLTGFKWLARVPELTYAYEEALGYCVAPGSVRDKDGISAALLVAEYAAELKAQGRTLLDALDDLARRHGLHATDQFSVRVDDLSQISDMLDRISQHPPVTIAGSALKSAEDLSEGVDGLPGTPGLRYRTTDGDRVIIRPSGTEPKLKCYLEVVVPADQGSVDAARQVAAERLARITADISQALGI
ncbi:phospho-sugar mutase [Kineosporia succinea]|uniref:Phosphomannomutase n=1 Tax=Kineosporia succinea TaxID=84632 RepID=A0ABT9P3S3_9ACTN|nr:phospho-sugar mutase [Kineosporia succinea]MDP9827349.1 phosphomannomutase [Kineosporia succinea]